MITQDNMKIYFTLLLTLAGSFFTIAQSESQVVDSLTKIYVTKLKQEDRKQFDRLFDQRNEKKLFERLDTIEYDVVLVEEVHCIKDSSAKITERYFSYSNPVYNSKMERGDSAFLPFKMFYMGDTTSVLSAYYSSTIAGMYPYNLIDYYYSLDMILDNFSMIKPAQEITYDADQAWRGNESESLFKLNKKEFEKKEIEKLKATYQIITLIDKKKDKILVSVQLPSKNPKLDLRYLYVSHDW